MTNKLNKKLDLSVKKLDELIVDLQNSKKELFTLRYAAAASELKNVSLFKKCRKNIARIKTSISAIINGGKND